MRRPMTDRIETARTWYHVDTAEAYATAHASALEALGEVERMIITPHREASPRLARVNFGRWMLDCACGAGIMADPAFAEARCFACGAIWIAVFPAPATIARLEPLLLARPLDARHWQASESIADVEAANAAHGV
jgi:hypothetical protein